MLEFLGMFDWTFVCGFLSIVIVDLILAGDNAVVIAMAVQSLPKEQHTKGIVFGAGAAVVLRVVFTFFVSQLLQIAFIKIAGGVLIFWIAIKLFMEGTEETAGDSPRKEAKGIGRAVWIIVVADLSMALDNMLAVAGASGGSIFLLIFGLSLSIPLVVCTSSVLAKLMNKYPIIIYIGAAVLGKVAGQMITTDPWLESRVELAPWMHYAAEAALAAAVIAAGKILKKIKN